jgi:hypothetical protein
MKLLKTSALALCLGFLSTPLLSKAQTLDPTQVYTTGNIVQDTPQGGPTPWVNGVYQDNLTCWGAGDPGYCGPNAIVRPGNVINFSYGSTYLYQQQAVAAILPNSGTGLQVSGYNFGFTAKNGNGWDDGRTDSLTALVRFWDTTGGRAKDNLLYGTSYDLNYKFNWTSFNFSENFTTPLAAPSIGQVQYGFIGRDNNGWAGPYGPEVYNVSFSLKYKVDPCATNVLSSPTCPGYLEAIAKLTPPAPESSLTTQPTDVGTIILVDSVLISPTGTYGTISSPESTSPDGSQPTPASSPTLLGGAPNSIQQAASSQPSATSPQTKIGEVADSGGSSKSTVSLSSVLSMIASNQEKTAALEKSVVQDADAQAFSAGETAKATAEKIAGDAQSQSISTSNSQATSAVQIGATQSFSSPMQSTAVAIQGNLQSNTVLNTARQEQANASGATGQQSTTTIAQQQSLVSSVRQDGVNIGQFSLQTPTYEQPKFESLYTPLTTSSTQYQPPARQEFSIAMVSPAISYSLVTPTRSMPQSQIEIPTLEGIRFGNRSPVEEAMESKPMMPQTNTGSQQGDSVKKNVQNNEAAGSVSIESIARQPVGYAQYFGMMPDVAFYSPKEIYRNQKTVDNVRVMRGLSGGSDRLHQEMVNQQYK